jgi:hypothetical protein
MRTSNFREGRRAAVFFRLCLAIIVSLTLAMAGMALKTEPVRAIGITADPVPPVDVPECVPFTIQFTATGTVCPTPPNPFFWTWGVLPIWVTLDPDTGLLTGCPPLGEAGNTYNFFVGVSEFHAWPPCGPFLTFMPVTLNVTANPAVCDMVIDPTFYPVAWENLPFSMNLSVTGGVGPFDWSATAGLPAGLSVTDPTNGVISGTPAPGTCGIYTVTANVTDTGTCCCPPVSRPFILIVDCLANYAFITYSTTACDFTVEIGPGLTQGLTKVLIDGSYKATLGGNQSETFTSVPCQSHLVTIDQIIAGSDPQTRFAVIGPNQKMVTDIDNYAYFDYAPEIYIQTGSEPSGIAQPPGTGFYAMGGTFSSTAPSTIDSNIQPGIKYVFREWKLPNGTTQPTRDLAFTVNQAGPVTAIYDTYYLLRLTSDYPPVDDSSWHLKDSTATYNLALQAVPMQGFWGGLGGQLRPMNASGTHLMTAPYTQEILWKNDYTMPIIAIVLILLVIAGLGYLGYRLRAGPATRPKTKAPAPKSKRRQPKAKASRPATRTGAKKATSRTRPKLSSRTKRAAR